MKCNKVFITGANGFVGKSLTPFLLENGFEVINGTRDTYGDIEKFDDWESLLQGVDVVVHLAAKVHVMDKEFQNRIEDFRKINVDATVKLAEKSKNCGVGKFIYLSSIKVCGEYTDQVAFNAADLPNPKDAYGMSKHEAEIELLKRHVKDHFDVVIIRPPLIYGKGVKANFERIIKLVKLKIPLPFMSVSNKRSLVSLSNLNDFILTVIRETKASGEIFLVRDKHNYSLADLVALIAKVNDIRVILFPFPVRLLKFGLFLVGKKDFSQRLFGNLHVDISKNEKLLNWKPKYEFEQEF